MVLRNICPLPGARPHTHTFKHRFIDDVRKDYLCNVFALWAVNEDFYQSAGREFRLRRPTDLNRKTQPPTLS